MRLYHWLVIVLAIAAVAVGLFGVSVQSPWLIWGGVIAGLLAALGIWDMLQIRHSVMRNYPIVGHLRWLFEGIRPEFRQYFFESDKSGRPFNRDQRALVYQRAKNVVDRQPFGTEFDVYEPGYAWVNHSIVPHRKSEREFRLTVGGAECKRPYSASVYNISAMSFGALSANAIRALNKGAKMGDFAHDTGEGAISLYHREHGGDLIWEIGSGYFGCRREDGSFDPERFAAQAANDQVKMVEIKLSQGAKPGHGGVLPGAKVTPEIAETRGVPVGVDCISPAYHSAFSTPTELLEFVAQLRELSGGKPAGFKLCIGHRWEFMGVVKAMLETGVLPDFIVVDGAEGGTGAAPPEFSDHLGTPLRLGLNFVRNVLVGTGLRDQIRIGASGKIISAFDIVGTLTLGADWCNSARGFMFAVGCIQSLSCHTNRCPVGVATQDHARQRALVVSDKAQRVYNFHRNTLRTLSEFIAAIGLKDTSELRLEHFEILRARATKVLTWLEPGELLGGTDNEFYARNWNVASADSFAPGRATQ